MGLAAAGLAGAPSAFSSSVPAPWFDISLAEFSFASDLFTGKMNHLDFPMIARRDYGIGIVEYVAMFFNGKETDPAYIKELKKRAADAGVRNHLIMVDGENIADLDSGKRAHAVESHYHWVDVANELGCTSIRVNLGALDQEGSAEEVGKAAVEGYSKLLEFGQKNKMNIIVENHIGHSCNGQWLSGVMRQVNHPRAGTLPDFGNFCVRRTKPATQDIAGYMATTCLEEYDKYKGVEELMPYAKGVSAKSHRFTSDGNDQDVDFFRMFDIIRKSGFRGIVGIEYEGGIMQMGGKTGYPNNSEGVRATLSLLEKIRNAG